MSTMKNIKDAIKIFKSEKCKFILMHCVSIYPTPYEKASLAAIKQLKKKFKTEIGLSDHSTSIFIPSLAVAIGAKVVEKHLTDNNNLIGPDHKSSLNIKDFKKMITNLRSTETILGTEPLHLYEHIPYCLFQKSFFRLN